MVCLIVCYKGYYMIEVITILRSKGSKIEVIVRMVVKALNSPHLGCTKCLARVLV